MKKKHFTIYNGIITRSFLYKIDKHKKLLKRRFTNTSVIKKSKSYNNNALTAIIDAFETVKNKKYDKNDRKAFSRCEEFRAKLLNNNTLISYEIFGTDKKNFVKNICKISSTPPVWSEFYYYLTKKIKPKNILKLVQI
ncbi:MAG: hypothetical protein ACOCWB_07955 [Bacteroidota bacterium]